MQIQQKNTNTYENVQRAKCTTTSDSMEQSHPYRTEMSLILSYNGNKSKYSTNKLTTDKSQESETDTPPPNLPKAMKLFPNKLLYTTNNNNNSNDKATTNIGNESNSTNENIDNTENEKMLTKSQINLNGNGGDAVAKLAIGRKSDKIGSNDKCATNDGENDELKSSKKENYESTSILKTTDPNGATASAAVILIHVHAFASQNAFHLLYNFNNYRKRPMIINRKNQVHRIV